MGKGAVLLRTSYGDRTSPVLRGAWVMGKLMGTPPTPPPPDVDTDLSQPKGEAPKTLRARLEQHRSKPGCNQCHGVIDPIGLALENFDAIGRWRDVDSEAKAPIDASTVLPNGQAVDGPAQLRDALFGGRDLFVRAFTEKLMMYALGRELQAVRHAPGARRGAPRGGAGLDCRPCRASCRAMRFAADCASDIAEQRAASAQGEELTMFLTKRHSVPPDGPEGRRCHAGAAAARRHGAGGHARWRRPPRKPKLRMGFFYIPHGAIIGNTSHGAEMDKWTPSGAGADFTLSPILKSLEPYKKYVTSFGNLQNQAMVGGVHGFAPATWLSGHAAGRGIGQREHVDDAGSGGGAADRPEHDAARRSSCRRKPRSRRPPAAARRASTTPRCRSATRTRRCRWSSTRARSSRCCSARATRRRSAPRSRTRRGACSTASPAARARCSATSAPAIASCSTTIWRRCARSSAA